MNVTLDSPTFTGVVNAEALNIGSSLNQEVPLINSGLITNPNFSNPSISNNTSQNIGINASIIEWNFLPNSQNDYLVLNRNNNVPQGYSQYLSVASTGGVLSQTINISKSTNYRVTVYLSSISQSNVELLLNNSVLTTWSINGSWKSYSFDFSITNVGNNVLGFRNTSNTMLDITGVTLFVQDIQVGDVSLDVSGNVFIKNGFVINKQNNSSSMSIISNNLNLNSNTNVTSNLKLSYLGSAGVLHSSADGTLSSSLISNSDISEYAQISDRKLGTITSSGKVSNSATSANIEPLSETIVLRDINGFSYSNTPTLNSNNNTVATTSFVQNMINNLVDNAPEIMNTLGELASAINLNGGSELIATINSKVSNTTYQSDKTGLQTSIDSKVSNTTYQSDKTALQTSINSKLSNDTYQIDRSDIYGKINNIVYSKDSQANKLVQRDDNGNIFGNNIFLSSTSTIQSDTNNVLTRGSNGYMYSTQIQDKHIKSDANISGSKLANNTIGLSKLNQEIITRIDTSLNLKANKSYVDTSLATHNLILSDLSDNIDDLANLLDNSLDTKMNANRIIFNRLFVDSNTINDYTSTEGQIVINMTKLYICVSSGSSNIPAIWKKVDLGSI